MYEDKKMNLHTMIVTKFPKLTIIKIPSFYYIEYFLFLSQIAYEVAPLKKFGIDIQLFR